MPDFTYTRDIPFASDTPAQDQPDMQNNTNSTDSLIEVDHYSFNTNDGTGGFHKQSQYKASVAIPAGLIAGNGTVYSETVGAASEIFFSPDASGHEYQLTQSVSASYALFGANTNNYNGAGVSLTGGWTFLPGGLLFQYGIATTPTLVAGTYQKVITFPVAFSANPYSVVITPAKTLAGTPMKFSIDFYSTTNVRVLCDTLFDGMFWTAIGPA